MTIKEIQNEIVDEFSMFDDWMQRYEYIIELGKTLPLIEEQYKVDENIIKGCQSKVWVHDAFTIHGVNFYQAIFFVKLKYGRAFFQHLFFVAQIFTCI